MIWDNSDLHVVIDHPNRCSLDDALFRSHVFESDVVNVIPRETRVVDVLVQSGLFKSRNAARKSWNRSFEWEDGLNRFERVGKLKRNIYVLRLPDGLPPYPGPR